MRTPGCIQRYVCERLKNRCPSRRIFQVARQLLMEAGRARGEITLDSYLIGRKFPWEALESRLGHGLRRLPWLGWAEERYTLRQMIRLCAKDWTSQGIWEAIVVAVSETLGIPPESIFPEADFHDQLGMS